MQRPVQITRLSKTEFIDSLLAADKQKVPREQLAQLPFNRLASSLETSVVSDGSQPVPNCQECGACCDFPALISMSREEGDRLGDFVEVTLDGYDAIAVDRMMRRNDETLSCVHLAGTIGERVECTAYAVRPSVCRGFEAGSDKCREFRRMYGLEPRLTDDEVAAALAKIKGPAYPAKSIAEAAIYEDYSFFEKILAALGSPPAKPKLKLVAFMEDNTSRTIHRFQPEEQNWLESEFWGLTLDEANALIASRKQQHGNFGPLS